MRRHGAEMLAAAEPIAAIIEVYGCITSEMEKQWFIHAGY
jgi:hypothetical protein